MMLKGLKVSRLKELIQVQLAERNVKERRSDVDKDRELH